MAMFKQIFHSVERAGPGGRLRTINYRVGYSADAVDLVPLGPADPVLHLEAGFNLIHRTCVRGGPLNQFEPLPLDTPMELLPITPNTAEDRYRVACGVPPLSRKPRGSRPVVTQGSGGEQSSTSRFPGRQARASSPRRHVTPPAPGHGETGTAPEPACADHPSMLASHSPDLDHRSCLRSIRDSLDSRSHRRT
jgi:hypothetical protein